MVADGVHDDVLTPEVLEPVYRVRVTSIEANGVRQLVLAPLPEPDRLPDDAPATLAE